MKEREKERKKERKRGREEVDRDGDIKRERKVLNSTALELCRSWKNRRRSGFRKLVMIYSAKYWTNPYVLFHFQKINFYKQFER